METKKERMIRQLRAKGFSEEEIEKRLLEAGLTPEQKHSNSEEIFTISETESGEGY